MENNAKKGSSRCPACETPADPATGLCLCPPRPANPSPGETGEQADSLFEIYLAARLLRAHRNLKSAKTALARDPRNRATLDQARHAEIETERLQAQLAAARRPHGAAPAGPPSAQATDGFRAVQAARAGESYPADAAVPPGRRSLPDERRCPQCGNPVLGQSSGCDCGYRFDRAVRRVTAEPFLSSEELAVLRGGVKAAKRAE